MTVLIIVLITLYVAVGIAVYGYTSETYNKKHSQVQYVLYGVLWPLLLFIDILNRLVENIFTIK